MFGFLSPAVALADTVGSLPFVRSPIDSAQAHGILAPLFSKLPIPQQVVLALTGYAASLAVDLLEWVLAQMSGIPAVAAILRLWKSTSRVTSPLLGILSGLFLGGDLLTGVIGGGIRGIATQGNPMRLSVDQAKRAVGAVAILAALMLGGATSASAQIAEPVPAKLSLFALERIHPAIGVESRWENDEKTAVRDVQPRVYLVLRATYVWNGLFQIQADGGRRLDSNSNGFVAKLGVYAYK